MAIEALHDAGLKPGDPAFDAALKFVTRCQNNSETNDQKWASRRRRFRLHRRQRRRHPKPATTSVPMASALSVSLRLDDLRRHQEHDLLRPLPKRPARESRLQLGPQELDIGHQPWHAILRPHRQNPKAAQSGLYYYYHTLARASARMAIRK